MSAPQEDALLACVRRATGSEPDLDAAIAARLDPAATRQGASPPAFTRSIDACLALVHQVRPGWTWHIGWGADGVMPYVTLSQGERRYEARASTIPLAILDVLLQVEIAEAAERGSLGVEASRNVGEKA